MRTSRKHVKHQFNLLIATISLLTLVAFNYSHPLPALHSQEDSSKLAYQAAANNIQAGTQESFGRMSLYFIENRGQLDKQVAYYVQGSDKTLYFTSQGVTFVLADNPHQQTDSSAAAQSASPRSVPLSDGAGGCSARQQWTLKLDFVGANPGVKPKGREQTPATISYFKGRKEQHHAGLKTYGSIAYAELWPGIDLVYSGDANHLKYTFLVKPGADPDQIKLAYRGATAISLDEAGRLAVSTPVTNFHDDKPYSYQEVNRQRVEVTTHYALGESTASGSQVYGFRVGDYDKSKPLVIDPTVLIYAGFISGSNDDEGNAIAVDIGGNAYVTGTTVSTEATFPVTAGPDLFANGLTDDAFVAKVKPDGTGLVYCGYIGGRQSDRGVGIAVDINGFAYITGTTSSDQTDTVFPFPTVLGPDLSYNSRPILGDAFVAKLNPSGTILVYCGYIGGLENDEGRGIAVDKDGNAYVTGRTESDEGSFPVKIGPDVNYSTPMHDSREHGDAFIAKVKADGTGLVYCGYIGGSLTDTANAIAVDDNGNAYVAGNTPSTQDTFPVTPTGFGPVYKGGFNDAFVAKVKADGTGLVYCGYIGGSTSNSSAISDDDALGIAVDKAGSAYVAGNTFSDETSFPVIKGPNLKFNSVAGTEDAFVAKVNPSGTALDYCGYIGGKQNDQGRAIAVDAAGNAYVAGFTVSNEDSFPVKVGPDISFNGGTGDGFVAEVKADGSGLIYCGYVGGSGLDFCNGIAVDGGWNAYITGFTLSPEPLSPTTIKPERTFNGSSDAFVAKINGAGIPCFTFQEAIKVPVDGSSVASATTLTLGVGYTLKASGSFIIGGPGFADAEYAFNDSLTTVINNCFGSPSEVDFGIGVNDTVIDNNKNPFWGSFTAEHIYTTRFTGLGAPITLDYHDCFYPDNSGFLTLEIFRPDFNVCIQDESNGNSMLFNSTTGVYRFNLGNGLTYTGRGTISAKGSTVTLQHSISDRRVQAQVAFMVGTANASLQTFSPAATYTLTDRDSSNNSCPCQ